MIGVTEAAANTGEPSAAQSAARSAALRRAMIDGQLRVSGVNDPAVLEPMDAFPREDFVPPERRAAAYTDRAVPLGHGRTLPPPLTHGQMLVEARPTSADNVLLIGGGTGYLAALVAPRVGSLTVVECSEELAAAAPAKPGRWVIGPLAQGAPEGAPYSLVLIDGAIEQLPQAIVDQLAEDGRVVTGLIEHGLTRLAVGRKAAGQVGFLTIADAAFAPLDEFLAPRGWSF